MRGVRVSLTLTQSQSDKLFIMLKESHKLMTSLYFTRLVLTLAVASSSFPTDAELSMSHEEFLFSVRRKTKYGLLLFFSSSQRLQPNTHY